MVDLIVANTVTTTMDDFGPGGALLSLTWEDGFWHVRDLIGLRYGAGQSPKDALNEWIDQVNDILFEVEGPLGEPLLSEVRAYRKALHL